MTQEELFKKLVAHCKEYGFIFPSSEIYDGLGAVYDYGQNGVLLSVHSCVVYSSLSSFPQSSGSTFFATVAEIPKFSITQSDEINGVWS